MIDEPIIVSGGSVNVDLSDKFKDNGSGKGKKKYTLENGTMLRLKVNGETVRELLPSDTVSIECDDGE